MKQSLILWIAAAIITFLVGFIQNRTSAAYPTSGTIGIESQKVSFHFKKVYRDKNDYVLLLRTEIENRILLNYRNKKYFLPENRLETILFLGPVPLSIDIHYYLTLFVGILLAIRAGLEYFNNEPRLRLYSIFTLISFFSCAMIFAPVKKAYEMGAIGKTVPPIEKIFDAWLLALIIIWILNLILVSYTKYPRKCVLIFSILTVLIFFSQNFIIG